MSKTALRPGNANQTEKPITPKGRAMLYVAGSGASLRQALMIAYFRSLPRSAQDDILSNFILERPHAADAAVREVCGGRGIPQDVVSVG